MDTTVNNNILNPRYYQIPQDKIEAKQAMEPIAISAGVGPMVGFDIVDLTQTNVRITGSSNPDITQSQRMAIAHLENKTVKLSINGQLGTVVNGHITPSGILSVNPVWLNTGLPVSQFTGHTFLVVRASLDFTTEIENNLEALIPPSISNFIFTRVTSWTHNGLPVSAYDLLNTNYTGVLNHLNSAGITVNETKEVIIGIYEFNAPETIREEHSSFYKFEGNVTPIIPYYNIWPPRANYDQKQANIQKDHTERIEWLENNRIIEVDTPNIKDGAVTTPKLANNAVNSTKLADNAVTTNKVANGAITTIKIADNAITSAKIGVNAITGEQIMGNSITTDKIANIAVTAAKISNGAITATKIGEGAVTNNHIGNNVITNSKLSDGAVTLSKLNRGTLQSIVNIGIGAPRSLYVEIDTNITVNDWVEVEIGGLVEPVILPLARHMAIPLNGATSLKFTSSPRTGDMFVRFSSYQSNNEWTMITTYTFSPITGGRETEVITLPPNTARFKVYLTRTPI